MDVRFYNTACREPENPSKSVEYGNYTLCLPDQPNVREMTRNISKNSLPFLIGGFGLHSRASRQVVNDIFAGAAMPSPRLL
jgi:hypothetical protein